MTLSIKCKADGCRHVIREDVKPGYSIGPILRRYGWTMAPSGFFCPDCQGAIPVKDFAAMNCGDGNAG